MSDLDVSPWEATVIPATDAPPAHFVIDQGVAIYAFPHAWSEQPVDLGATFHLACAGRVLLFEQAWPAVAAGWNTALGANAWFFDWEFWPPEGLPPAPWGLNVPPAGAMQLPPAVAFGNTDAAWACSIDLRAGGGAATAVTYSAPASPVPRPDSAAWVTQQTIPLTGLAFSATEHVVIGGNQATSAGWPTVWRGRIYWVEMRSGLVPGQGALLWRFDASEYPGGNVATWTDPRGRVWKRELSGGARPVPGVPTQLRATVLPPG